MNLPLDELKQLELRNRHKQLEMAELYQYIILQLRTRPSTELGIHSPVNISRPYIQKPTLLLSQYRRNF